MARWLLPEGISDVLPHEARRIEHVRRVLLDLYRGYGYELVMPPLLEYLDSLKARKDGKLVLGVVRAVSERRSGLAPRTIERLRAVSTPIHLEVFALPT